ncbi:hypothetical protein BD779DRAFT_1433847 [Infundibulicybe gibba]|nr:hypothetical protein BD779DRAFT_1433847 [Infundibulicybe gibba]
METQYEFTQLSSLSDWSVHHIRDIFEAGSDQQSLWAVASTFSEGVNATINGKPIRRDDISQLVLSMRQGSPGLKVQWQQAAEAPRDPSTNRDGHFDGVYVIRGIRKVLPGANAPVEYERHKSVTVTIESQSSNPTVDSRKITNLAFVASDVRVNRQASL